jgi:hypothetical protein
MGETITVLVVFFVLASLKIGASAMVYIAVVGASPLCPRPR